MRVELERFDVGPRELVGWRARVELGRLAVELPYRLHGSLEPRTAAAAAIVLASLEHPQLRSAALWCRARPWWPRVRFTRPAAPQPTC